MPNETVFASLRDWEDGTDLVLTTTLPAERSAAWLEITDPVRCGEWFAPWRRENTAEGDLVSFVFDEDTLQAQVLSTQQEHHVLLEFAGLGRVGISLDDTTDAAATDAPASTDGAAPADAAAQKAAQKAQTRVTVTHTFESRAAAVAAAPEIGPVWHTHLLMLASALGANVTPPDDATLTDYYTQLVREAAHD